MACRRTRCSLDIARNETVALVGESGSGKSVTALSILRLLPTTAARHAGGQILLEGRDLSALPEAQLTRVRGNRIAMVFQDLLTSQSDHARGRSNRGGDSPTS